MNVDSMSRRYVSNSVYGRAAITTVNPSLVGLAAKAAWSRT